MWPKLTKVDAEKHPIEIRYYGAKPSIYELYDDDGETYDYEKGEYLRIPIEVRVDSEGKRKVKYVFRKENRHGLMEISHLSL